MYAALAAHELAKLIRSGKADPVEIATEFSARIAANNERLRALCYVHAEFHENAAALRGLSAHARKRAKLLGVPFSVKENIDVRGMPVGRASKLHPSRTATKSARVVELVQGEHALCVGKGNMPERGRAFVTDNPVFGRTLNPFHPEVSPGGSSGGDAAAVAAGFCSFALVNDAAGSIRVPAAFCGLFGYLPTGGTISDAGQSIPPTALMSLFRRTGFFARDLEDVSLLVSILNGFDPLDANSVPFPATDITPRATFAVIRELNDIPCHDSVAAALEAAVVRFRDAGLTEVEAPTPLFCQAAEPFILLMAQAGLKLEDELLAKAPAVPDAVEGPLLQALRSRISTELPPLTAERVLLSWQRLHQLRDAAAQRMQNIDLLLMPVCAVPPPRHESTSFRIGQRSCSVEEVFQFSFVVNALGLPAITFPTGCDAEGLPIGLQIVGQRFSEPLLERALREAGYTLPTPSPLLIGTA